MNIEHFPGQNQWGYSKNLHWAYGNYVTIVKITCIEISSHFCKTFYLYLNYCAGETLPLFKIYSPWTLHSESFLIFLAMIFFALTKLTLVFFYQVVIWGKKGYVSNSVFSYRVYKKELCFCLRMSVLWFKSMLSWLSGMFNLTQNMKLIW